MASAAPIIPRYADAIEAANRITRAGDLLYRAARELDGVPGFFLPDVAELTTGIDTSVAAELVKIGQRIQRDFAVQL